MIERDKDYEFVPELPQEETKGVQCGKCGIKFDYGKAIVYYCPNQNCPLFAKATC